MTTPVSRPRLLPARAVLTPFLWGAITDPAERRVRFDEALIATLRIIRGLFASGMRWWSGLAKKDVP